MAQKGSKFARKQRRLNQSDTQKSQPSKEVSVLSAISDINIEESAVLSVIYDDVSFISTFHSLDYENQIATYQVLTLLSKPSNQDDESRNDAIFKLERIAKSIGLEFTEKQDCFLSKDERHIIRMDFYGAIDRLKESEQKRKLSKPYMELMSTPLKKRHRTEDYDFTSAPMWPLFERFNSFRKIEKKLKQYLVRKRIDPKILSLMDVRDFSDLISKTFQKSLKQVKMEKMRSFQKSEIHLRSYLIDRRINPDVFAELGSKIHKDLAALPDNENVYGIKAHFEEPMSVRKKFVHAIVDRYGDEIKENMLAKGYDKRYVLSMLNAMKKYGSTKTEKLVITETHFTDRILKDLKKFKINCFKKGEPIPQVLVDYLIEGGQGDLIAARDEEGQKILASDFPSFEVHHKHAVSESGDLSNIASINYPDNLCLVFEKIHAHVLHGMDIIVSEKQCASYSRRTEFINDDVIIMAGLNKEDQLSCSFTNTNGYKKRQKQDSAKYASYAECYAALLKNQSAYKSNSVTTSNKKELDINFVTDYVSKTYKQRKAILKMIRKRHDR